MKDIEQKLKTEYMILDRKYLNMDDDNLNDFLIDINHLAISEDRGFLYAFTKSVTLLKNYLLEREKKDSIDEFNYKITLTNLNNIMSDPNKKTIAKKYLDELSFYHYCNEVVNPRTLVLSSYLTLEGLLRHEKEYLLRNPFFLNSFSYLLKKHEDIFTSNNDLLEYGKECVETLQKNVKCNKTNLFVTKLLVKNNEEKKYVKSLK